MIVLININKQAKTYIHKRNKLKKLYVLVKLDDAINESVVADSGVEKNYTHKYGFKNQPNEIDDDLYSKTVKPNSFKKVYFSAFVYLIIRRLSSEILNTSILINLDKLRNTYRINNRNFKINKMYVYFYRSSV